MAHLRFRDDDDSSRGLLYLAVGAIAGLAAGMVIAERFGGLAGVTDRVRSRFQALERDMRARADEMLEEDMEEEEYAPLPEEELEVRVLEAFRNDPLLSERALDIGAVSVDTIELSGWVQTADEADHAVTLARGVPGVVTVVNRIDVRTEEAEREELANGYSNGDTANGGFWEGQQVGTGRRRQGTSDEFDRHADPRPALEDKWLDTDQALAAAAEDVELSAGNRPPKNRRSGNRDRTGGAPIAPSGVPKGDHVNDPVREPPRDRAD
ncbi:MAG TPA: BON domain-containing protein [Gemmatimonadaceae bacterium]|nr:BON domain-containing protein [Gemmatimonadaceae bacterium]